MIISDLNILEAVEGSSIVGGGGFQIANDKLEHIESKVNVDILKKVDIAVKLVGNFADAQAVAQAYGANTDAETITFAEVYEGVSSDAASRSTAAAVKDQETKYY
ncbi:hypothetical protein [Umezakia ovalisporum]|nr:hypothetical protein [Umezakia ovalisporum]MBI1241951.1 hypothetical protein [Nostoc sp. RI_552]MDH6058506.1 hypothetical protein [Umezakia ovalisporum FSS-43]MDH6067639.1 hypothetical protein [Umezakia ovalisporum APH033B]MDH6077559.1 hypothetical protein [Umezakia ovalisporum FSS-45]CEJ47855.1 Uncharacterized protein apha_03203 [Umezakia ovalisporum]